MPFSDFTHTVNRNGGPVQLTIAESLTSALGSHGPMLYAGIPDSVPFLQQKQPKLGCQRCEVGKGVNKGKRREGPSATC